MSAPSPLAQTRVLLIDDDELVAGPLRHYLSVRGADVDVALDRRDAEARMQVTRYDVIVVDPYLTGAVHDDDAALLAAIGTLQPEASTIVLTAYTSPELARAATTRSVLSFLTKPQSVVSVADLVVTSSKGRP